MHNESDHTLNDEGLEPNHTVHLREQLPGGDDVEANLVESHNPTIKPNVDQARELRSFGDPLEIRMALSSWGWGRICK